MIISIIVQIILPNFGTKLKIAYSYTLNKGSHIFTGEVDIGAHFIAYFFPRVAVYVDIDGWNKIPYSGAEEFYNDFCDFKVAITVPKDYTVWATGDLINPTAFFEKSIRKKLELAEKSDETINVIDSVDLAQNKVRQQSGFGYLFIKDYLGGELFTKALHHY